MSASVVVRLGREGRLVVARADGHVLLRRDGADWLRLTRRQAWRLAEALDAVATAAAD